MMRVVHLIAGLLLTAGVVYVLSQRVGAVPPVGVLFDPADGLYRTARLAERPSLAWVDIPGLDSAVTVIRDERGVPHVFAASDKDAVMAMGYLVAQDRLFQMDFFNRAAGGRLAEVLGPSALPVDRYFRQIGMELGARRNLERVLSDDGLELDLLRWYAAGANAYIEGLAEEDLPFEFRLLGYAPEPYSPMHAMRLLQYMAFDLSFHTDDAAYAELRNRLGDEDYRALYPQYARMFVPIIPEAGGGVAAKTTSNSGVSVPEAQQPALSELSGFHAFRERIINTVAEGFVHGKGSNNWAVHGSRSSTGAPILADDMHLNLSLPALWYEVHLVTPQMNVYGVTFPDAPLPVQAYNDYLGWGFTNTGADQIDYYALMLDETGTRYRYDGAWRPLETVLDTIRVRGEGIIIDTLYYSHWGPVVRSDTAAFAIRWTAHGTNRTLAALWGMNHATDHREFEEATRLWDAPMQNILYADVEGNIAIRSAGYLPMRRSGTGAGLLDGSSDTYEWTGRVPFEDLPSSLNPDQGWLASTNQQPTDSLYPYYLGHDWREAYRSMRISQLLSGKERHSVEDLKRYQADVHAVQRDLFVPLIAAVDSLSARAASLQALLAAWDGDTGVDRTEPLVMFEFLNALEVLAWDEPAFQGLRPPSETVLLGLLRDRPDDKWLDITSTVEREGAIGLLRAALEQTADTLEATYGWGEEHWRWGDHHKVVFRHVTRSEALTALWRGPMEYPGFMETLSPAGRLMTTHSASWRVVVDFSQSPPEGWGVYPGGPSGNPFSPYYDASIPAYLRFQHHRLLKPASPDALGEADVSSRLHLRPASE